MHNLNDIDDLKYCVDLATKVIIIVKDVKAPLKLILNSIIKSIANTHKVITINVQTDLSENITFF